MSPELGPKSDLESETLNLKSIEWPFKLPLEEILVNILASHGLTQQWPANLLPEQHQEIADFINLDPFELNDRGQKIMDSLQEALAGANSLKPSWPPIEDPTSIGKRTLSMFNLFNLPSKSELSYFLKEFIPDIRELTIKEDWKGFVKKYGIRLVLVIGYVLFQSGLVTNYVQGGFSHDLLEKITPEMALFTALSFQVINLFATYQVAKTEDQIPVNMLTALVNDFLNSFDSSEKLKEMKPLLVFMAGVLDKLQYESWKIPTFILMGPEIFKATYVAETGVAASEAVLNYMLSRKVKSKK